MAKNILMDLAFENLHKCMGISDWKESDEVILVSSANKKIRIQKLVRLFKRSIQNPRQHEPIRLRGRGREAVFGDFKK